MVPDMGLLGSMCVVRLLSKRIFTRRIAPLPDFSIILKKKKVVLISQTESGCVFFAFAFFQLFARESICIPFPSNYSFCFVNHSHSLPHLLTFNVFKKCLLAFWYTAPLNPFWSFYTYFFPGCCLLPHLFIFFKNLLLLFYIQNFNLSPSFSFFFFFFPFSF